MCRHDHGLNWAEAKALTLPEYEALEERRMVSIRHARFNAGLMASVYFNAHRSEDTDPIEVWDFIPGYARTAEDVEDDKRRKAIKQSIKLEMTSMFGSTPERIAAKRKQLISRMREDGVQDPEGIYRECFPDE